MEQHERRKQDMAALRAWRAEHGRCIECDGLRLVRGRCLDHAARHWQREKPGRSLEAAQAWAVGRLSKKSLDKGPIRD